MLPRMARSQAIGAQRRCTTIPCHGHQRTTPITRPAQPRSSRLRRISRRRLHVRPRKVIRTTTRAAVRLRPRRCTDRLRVRRPATLTTLRPRIPRLRPMPPADRASASMAREVPAPIRQVRPTAPAAATDRVRQTRHSSYSASPAYAARSYAPQASYSAPRYSAPSSPRYSGGSGGGYHASGGWQLPRWRRRWRTQR